MTISKSAHTYIASGTTNAAGATTTGTARNMATDYGALVTIKIANGATAPTVAASAKIYTSIDGTNWKLFYTVASDTVSNSVNEWAIDLPRGAMYSRVDVAGNTVQGVTCEAFAQVVTGL